MDIIPVKISRKAPKHFARCQVCGGISHYHYYGVWCCEGCKQFFRRVVSGGKRFVCLRKKECGLVKGKKCRSCRFDKCLEVGMNPQLVGAASKEYIECLEEYQTKLMLGASRRGTTTSIKTGISVDPNDFGQLLVFLTPIERAYNRIWDSPMALPPAYVNRHEHLEKLLKDEYNLLASSEQFTIDPNIYWDKAAFVEEIEVKGLFSTNPLLDTVARDWFLALEVAKAMPFFKRLDLEDQLAQFKHVFVSVTMLCGAYYSHAISAQTVTRCNGFTPVSYLETRQFRSDERIRSISCQSMCEMVERMDQLQARYEEFLLLLAVLFSNSTAEDLSARGRELLYAESVRYSKALLKMLQAKLGGIEGCSKFATLMGLLEYSFKAKYQFGALMVYLEVFYEKRNPTQFLPKALRSLAFTRADI